MTCGLQISISHEAHRVYSAATAQNVFVRMLWCVRKVCHAARRCALDSTS